jgi:hypothetical protein
VARSSRPFDGLEAAGYERADWSTDRRAQWLLEFASLDLGRVTQRELRKLRGELGGFLWSTYADQTMAALSVSPTGRRVRVVRRPRMILTTGSIPHPSKATLVKWQRWLRQGLDGLSGQDPFKGLHPSDAGPITEWVIAPKGIAYCLHRFGSELYGSSMMRHASPQDWFQDFTYQTLTQTQSVRFCEACGQPFLRRRRQVYCSPKCSQKIRTGKHRLSHRPEINKRRRLAYEKKQREKLGPKVRVGRSASLNASSAASSRVSGT